MQKGPEEGARRPQGLERKENEMEKEKRKRLVEEYKLKKTTGGVYMVRNQETGTFFLKGDTNLEGSKNRFEFSQKTGSCVFHQLRREWDQYGPAAFEFVVLEEIEQKAEESGAAFKDRLKKLEEKWKEKQEELTQERS